MPSTLTTSEIHDAMRVFECSEQDAREYCWEQLERDLAEREQGHEPDPMCGCWKCSDYRGEC